MGTTLTHGLPYPENTDLVTNGAAAVQQLAEAVDGKLPTSDGVPIGAVSMFGGPGAQIPAGWLRCDGAAVSRTEYADLFNVVTTYYGQGDGSTTFNLPDLTARFPVGAGGAYGLGETGGADAVALTEQQMPSHSHSAPVRITNAADGTGATLWSYNDVGAGTQDTSVAGGDQAHENRPPFVALLFIIKAQDGAA